MLLPTLNLSDMGLVRIELCELNLYGHHGVSEQEQKIGGRFVVTLTAEVNTSEAALASDRLDGTVDYGAVCDLVCQEFDKPSHLIENVAWRIARRVINRFATIACITVRVEKLAPPVGAECRAAAASIRIEREQ